MSTTDGTLVVRLHDREVGTLHPTRRGARFAYCEDALDTWRGRPLLSLSLPVKRRPYAEGLTGSWFRGLLPEGDRLASICRMLRCEENDYISLLAHIGWECAGAVSIAAPGFEPPKAAAPRALNPDELAEKLRELPAYGGIDLTARVSLGGFQEKLLVVASQVVVREGYVSAAEWAEPDPATISTHIIKPQPQNRYPHIIEAEAWAMTAARRAARCSEVALLKPAGAPLSLVVRRFDRIEEEGVLRRVHQEDCCQALGLPPTGKYAGTDMQRGTDPTYSGIARLLALYADDPRREQRELLRQMVVNLALGNTDAHAKNYALLYREPAVPTVAPLYDVIPVVDIEPRASQLSIRIGGEIEVDDVGHTNVIAEAEGWGLQRDVALDVVDDVLGKLTEGIEAASALYPDAGTRHREGALRRIERLLG